MAGSWETPPSIIIGILHTDITTIHWSFAFKNLIVPGTVVPVTGMPFDHARNAVCMRAIEGGFDYVGFLDSDVMTPPDAFLRLMKHNLPIVSGMYCRRSPPHSVPVMMRNGQWVTDFKMGSMVEVDVVGAGCLVIRRDVLQNVPATSPERGKQWFDWRVDAQSLFPPGEAMSEDFSYCSHLRKHGIKIMVDTSVRCKHVGLAEADYGLFGPVGSLPAA